MCFGDVPFDDNGDIGGSVLIVQGLCPMEVPNFEVDLIRQPFADIYFHT